MKTRSKTTPRKVGAYEAKTHLPQLLDAVEEGQAVIITRRSREVARLIPQEHPEDKKAVFSQLRAFRAGLKKTTKESARELIDAGRRI